MNTRDLPSAQALSPDPRSLTISIVPPESAVQAQIEGRFDQRGMERRWHHRHETDMAARILFNGCPQPQPCRIRNYSMGGLFITFDRDMPLTRHQFVIIQIPQRDGVLKAIRGMVIHTLAGGAGIEAEERFWPRQVDMSGWQDEAPTKPLGRESYRKKSH